MDKVIMLAKLICIIHFLMAVSLLVGVWIGRRSRDNEDQ